MGAASASPYNETVEPVSRLARGLRRLRNLVPRAARGRDPQPWPGRDPIEPLGGQAARIMEDALWIEKLTATEAAEAMRRPVEWVQGVVDGTVEPTLDELELAVNAIGLETRIGTRDSSRHLASSASHRQMLADKIARLRDLDFEMYGETWIQRGPPQPGATARLFFVGPGRTDGGGWAAMLTRSCLSENGITPKQLAARAGIPKKRADQLARGEWKPTVGEFERILAACGVPMSIRLEAYEHDDDDAHAFWESGPEDYEARINSIRQEIQTWKPIPQAQTPPTNS